MILLKSVIGPCSGIEYGKQGEEVTLIARHDTMAIVEKGKVRFPVKFEILSEEEPKEQTIQETEPVIERTPTLSRKKTKGSKSKNQNQTPSLF